MASRVTLQQALGTDGSDFQHRQKIALHYQNSATNKSRLTNCIFFHYFVFLIMLAKLSPDILDRLDIFILSIEELQVPQPLWWEYIWCTSLLVSIIGLMAIKRNDPKKLQQFMVGIAVLGCGPILYAFLYYFKDVWKYFTTWDLTDIQVWRDMPYGLLWYFFIAIAVQVHGFSLCFSWKLLKAWKVKRK